MNKINNFILFASISAFSRYLIFVFEVNKRKNSRKKIDREIQEVLKKISETSAVVLNNSSNDDGDSGRFIT